MTFDEFLNLYGEELIIFPRIDEARNIVIFANCHGFDKKGEPTYHAFRITGDFKLHALKDEDGWKIDYVITTFDIKKIDDENNIYSLNEYMGAYFEFSVENCVVEEIPYEEYVQYVDSPKPTPVIKN